MKIFAKDPLRGFWREFFLKKLYKPLESQELFFKIVFFQLL